MKRILFFMIFLLYGNSLFSQGSITNATNYVVLNTGGGLLSNGNDGMQITVSKLGNIQIRSKGKWQIYAPLSYTPSSSTTVPGTTHGIAYSVGTQVFYSGTLYPSNGASTSSYFSSSNTTFSVSGSGASVQTYTQTTQFGSGYSLKVDIKYTYPQHKFDITYSVVIPSGNTLPVKVAHGWDTYLDGSDYGPGYAVENSLAQSVGVRRDAATFQAFVYKSGVRWSGYFSAAYTSLRDYLGTDYFFSSYGNLMEFDKKLINTGTYTDNGIGMSINFGSTPGTYETTNIVTFQCNAPTAAPIGSNFVPSGVSTTSSSTYTLTCANTTQSITVGSGVIPVFDTNGDGVNDVVLRFQNTNDTSIVYDATTSNLTVDLLPGNYEAYFFDLENGCRSAGRSINVNRPACITTTSISKTALGNAIGGPLTYTIVVTNSGASANAAYVVTDILPQQYNYTSHTVTAGTATSPSNVIVGGISRKQLTWNIPSLAAGASATLVVSGSINNLAVAGTSFANTASVTSFANPLSQSATATVTPIGAVDLSITKSLSSTAPLTPGNQITYELIARNESGVTETAAVVNDLLPTGITFVSASPTQGTYNSSSGVWTIGSLPVGATAKLTLVGTYNSGAPITNTATITGTLTDIYSANNSSSVTVLDSDNDKIVDHLDKDDDNDGIMDETEVLYCNASTAPNGSWPTSSNSTTSPILTNQILFWNWQGVTLSNASPSASRSVVYNGTTYTATITGYFAENQSHTISGANIFNYPGGGNHQIGAYYDVSNISEVFLKDQRGAGSFQFFVKVTATRSDGTVIPVDVLVFDAETTTQSYEKIYFRTNGTPFTLVEKTGLSSVSLSNIVTGDGTQELNYFNTQGSLGNAIFSTKGVSPTVFIKNSTDPSSTTSLQAVGFAVRLYCDTDSDGIPNFLDLDSDGDGCSDAIEGGDKVIESQLSNNRISGSVDANGVPVLVNSGGGADVDGLQGQGVGLSNTTTKAVVSITNLTPTSQTICLNSTAQALSLTTAVTPSNFAPLHYQWYRNTTNSTTGGTAITGANAATYTPPTNVAGTFYYYVVVTADCSTATSSTVVFTVNPITPIISVGAATCTNVGTATITNYDTTMTYTFSPVGPTIGVGGVINGLTPNVNYIVYGSTTGCSPTPSQSFSIAPIQASAVVPSIQITPATCSSPSIATISNYSSAYTYQFTPAGPTVNSSGVISNMAIGQSYTVVATAGSCSSVQSSSFSISNAIVTPAQPIVSVNSPTCSQNGSAVISNYNSSYTYIFTPTGPTIGASGVINGLQYNVSYSVVASNNGCNSVASTSFTVQDILPTPQTPTLNVQAPSCMQDGSASVTNYNGDYTYSFVPSGPTVGSGGSISGMIPGTNYLLTASRNGCNSNSSSSFKIDSRLANVPPIVLSNIVQPTCFIAQGSFKIEGYNQSLYIYTISPMTAVTISNSGVVTAPAGSYTITVANGICPDVVSTVTLEAPVGCACYEFAATDAGGQETKYGITTLKRAGVDQADNWPMVRKSGHMALESNSKGFVVTRMTTNQLSNILSPQEGMMVYDSDDKCLKIYSDNQWKCFSIPSCP